MYNYTHLYLEHELLSDRGAAWAFPNEE